ncbi:MAG: PqqD family protein [Eubacteriales bacterium]|nr:PqqD family protein [Eubacteriales bacterium]
MKIKKGFLLREVGGTHVVVAVGKAAAEFRGVARLNETAAYLFKRLQSGAARDELVNALLECYEVDRATADADVQAALAQFAPMLEDER